MIEFEKTMESVNGLFQYMLLHLEEGQDAYDYLISRGFTEKTITEFGFGRTIRKDGIARALMNNDEANKAINELIAWGLIRVDENGQATDFFKGRFMIPIRNENGNLVGFSGRVLPKNTHPAKYLNSPENDYFKKRTILFNLHRAKKAIQQLDYAVLMEGYLDVAMAVQEGFENCVGTMGTALTLENITNLKKYTNNIVVMFDGDKAGVESAIGNAKLLIANGFNVRLAYLPNEIDPHEMLLKQGKDAFNQALVNNYSLYQFTNLHLQNKYNFSVEVDRVNYANEMLDALKHEENNSELFISLSQNCAFDFNHANYYLNQM